MKIKLQSLESLCLLNLLLSLYPLVYIGYTLVNGKSTESGEGYIALMFVLCWVVVALFASAAYIYALLRLNQLKPGKYKTFRQYSCIAMLLINIFTAYLFFFAGVF